MTSGQRWLAIIALGASCWVMASTFNAWLNQSSTDGGWFSYAPANGIAFSPAPSSALRSLAVWLVAIVIWFGLSYLLLRRPPGEK